MRLKAVSLCRATIPAWDELVRKVMEEPDEEETEV
jgi:hypothetical protein